MTENHAVGTACDKRGLAPGARFMLRRINENH
jgi:hypothetical protein